MSFLRRIFGERQPGDQTRSDGGGFFLYVQCDRCGDRVRLRIDKAYDLNRSEDGYVWHKTIVDNRCFRPMSTVVHFDRNYAIVNSPIEGGHYISREEFETAEVRRTTDLDNGED